MSKYGNVVQQFDLPFCIFIVCQCALTAFDYIYFWALAEHNIPSYFGTSEVQLLIENTEKNQMAVFVKVYITLFAKF